jgi:A/G-specific adenine glycosylase
MVDSAALSETRARVLAWFAAAGRDLPWRATRDPYRVLVAEVLAQQTQAARAAAAWPRFLERFPDVEALAAATPAEVLRAWQGLGYNRRALALRRTAQAVVELGGWPDTVEGLAALPGVGPYTARAVACFALGLPVAPVDTNVARVLARALAGTDPGQLTPAARQRLADQAMPPPPTGAPSRGSADPSRPTGAPPRGSPDPFRPTGAPPRGSPDPSGRAWAWSSALMDVGALHCRPRPRCSGCPLAPSCRWRALGPEAPPARPRVQAPFAASDRRWRGAVVRALAGAADGMDRAALAEAVQAAAADRPPGWFDDLLARLESEGMVATGADGRLRLPA